MKVKAKVRHNINRCCCGGNNEDRLESLDRREKLKKNAPQEIVEQNGHIAQQAKV
jgi:hypothetical protein